MPEPAPILPGLYAAVATGLGTFLCVDRVRPEVQDGATGFFTHRVGADAVVLARGFGVFRGNERTRELAAIPPPAALDGPADAIEYAQRLAAVIAEEGWDLCLALAILRPIATGLMGWIVGGVQVFCVDPLEPAGADGSKEVRPCSPPQTLQVPPGVELPPGLDPARLLVSGVTSTVGGGDWFEAPGRRFAIFLVPPPLSVPRAALGDVAAAYPQHLLQRLGALAIQREVALVADWSLPTAAPRERNVMAYLASANGGPQHGAAATLAELLEPARGLLAMHLAALDELPSFAAQPGASWRDLATHLLHRVPSLAAVAAFVGGGLCRSLLLENAEHTARLAELFHRPTRLESLGAKAALTLSILARSCGAQLPSQIEPRPWLDELARKRRRGDKDFTLGLLCLAFEHPAPLSSFVGAAPRRRFRAGQLPGPEPAGFIHSLRGALDAGAGRDAVTPAWHAFLCGFPGQLAARRLDWGDLTLAAYVLFHRIARVPEAEVATRLASDLHRLGQDPPPAPSPAASPAPSRSAPDLPPFVRRWERTGADLIVEVQAGKQTHSGGLARATVRFTPVAPADSPVSVECVLSEEALPARLREALQAGITEAAARGGVTGFRAVIEDALVHPIDATVEKFRTAGVLCIEALGRLQGRG